jgi:uncharacterized protein VirK/YbjX
MISFDESQIAPVSWPPKRDSLDKALGYARGLPPSCKRRTVAGFLLGVLMRPALYEYWFDYLENGLPKAAPYRARGHLAEHVMRRYMRRWFSVPEKMDMLRSHYDLLDAHFMPSVFERLRPYPGLPLAQITGKSGRVYTLSIYHAMNKEGEISFCFKEENTTAMSLATLTGTFGHDHEGRKALWIGAMQGPSVPGGREAVTAATRDLNVLRPKQALLHAAAAMCAWMGIDHIYAPPHRNHVSYRWWRPVFTRHKIFSDYDAFWGEFTHTRAAWGDFHIALPLPRRKPEDVQPKRRKDWCRRYERIDAITSSTKLALDALKRIEKTSLRLIPALCG